MVQFSKDYPGGFIDGPTGGTPITAQVENNIEQGIADEDVRNPSSPASVALNGLYGHDVRAWAPNTQYTAGQAVVNPSGDVVTRNTAGQSAGTWAADAGNWTLSTTFAARPQYTLYPESFGAVGDGVTDDTAAINAMIAHAVSLVSATVSHIVMQFDEKEYLLSSPPSAPNGAGTAYAQIRLPSIPMANVRPIFEFRGTSSVPIVGAEAQTVLQKGGTILRSTASGGLDANLGVASVVGGPALDSVGATFSNLAVVWDGIVLRRPDNPTIAGLDFSYVCQAKTNNITIDTTATESSITPATHVTNIGLMMPVTANYAISSCYGDTFIFGCYAAVRFSEHFTMQHLMAKKNIVALAATNATHASVIHHANLEWNNYLFADVNLSGGYVTDMPSLYLTVTMLDIEDALSAPWAPVSHVKNANSSATIYASYVRVQQNTGIVAGPLTVTGNGLTTFLKDLTAPEAWTTATLTSPWVSYDGGTSSSGYDVPAYRKTSNGFLELRGAVKGGASATPVFTLPAGLRPNRHRVFAVASYPAGSVAMVDVNTSGDVIPLFTGTPTLISLDGVRYPAEQ